MNKFKKLVKRVAIGFGIFFVIGLAFSIYVVATETPEEKAEREARMEQREADKEAKALAKEQAEAEKIAQQEAEEQVEIEAKAKAEQEEVEKLAKEEADRKAKEEAEEKAAQEKAEKEAKQKAEEQAKKDAEAQRKAQKEADEKVMKDTFYSGTDSLIELGNGVIIGIRIDKILTNTMYVEMIVSDDWYYSPEHTKQRFADTMHDSIYKLAVGSGLMKSGNELYLDIEDAYGAKVAEYSIWSGMKIKK